jgi:hypothetical protein
VLAWNGLPTLYTRAVAGVQESEPSHSSGGGGVERWAFRGKSRYWSLPFGIVGRPDPGFVSGENAFGKRRLLRSISICVFIAVVVVCCGEVGMRGKTVWAGAARAMRDFQNRTMRMWGLRRTGGWCRGSGPDLQRRPQARTRDTQGSPGGWVEIGASSAPGAAIQRFGFPRVRGKGPGLQRIHRERQVVEEQCTGRRVSPSAGARISGRESCGGGRWRRRRVR